jgi:hypothetical protein
MYPRVVLAIATLCNRGNFAVQQISSGEVVVPPCFSSCNLNGSSGLLRIPEHRSAISMALRCSMKLDLRRIDYVMTR